MEKTRFKAQLNRTFYNKHNYRFHDLPEPTQDIITDVVLTYYNKGKLEGFDEGRVADKINWDLPHIVVLVFLLTVLCGVIVLIGGRLGI